MTDASEKILNRVRGLLAKAEDPACTPHEAEAFSAKAEELIAKYAVDLRLLESKEDRGKPTMITVKMTGGYARPKTVLLQGIAKAHGCNPLRTGDSNVIYGFETDLALVQALYGSLLLQATNALLHQSRSDRTFRTSFWYGFASRAVERVKETTQKAEREVSNEPGNALVLVDRKKEVDSAFREAHPNVRTTSGGRVGSNEGFGSGQSAANRADIGNTRVGGSRRSLSA